jgi:hypothetical protein
MNDSASNSQIVGQVILFDGVHGVWSTIVVVSLRIEASVNCGIKVHNAQLTEVSGYTLQK